MALMFGQKSSAGASLRGVSRKPHVSFYRILPGKSTDDGRQVLGGYRATVVVDGFAVYEVLARDGLGLVLAHCWAHTKRKYEDIADRWPIACAEIRALIGELYAIERLVPRPFPGDASAQRLRQQLRKERSRPILVRRGSAHPARQQRGRASAPRPLRRPQESLWVALAPWKRGRRRLLHALRNRPPGRRRSACISSACRLRGNRPTRDGYVP
jgi:hypothetical protein